MIATIAGDLGKPRPVVIVQSDVLAGGTTVLVSPCTTTILPASFRLTLEPTAENGLRLASQVMVDKTSPIRRDRCGSPIGSIGPRAIEDLDGLLALVFGLDQGAGVTAPVS